MSFWIQNIHDLNTSYRNTSATAPVKIVRLEHCHCTQSPSYSCSKKELELGIRQIKCVCCCYEIIMWSGSDICRPYNVYCIINAVPFHGNVDPTFVFFFASLADVHPSLSGSGNREHCYLHSEHIQ